jgi:hypothetical protein
MRALGWLLALGLTMTVLAGCLGPADEPPVEDVVEDPFVPLPPPLEVHGLEVVAQVKLEGINEITLRDGFAYASGYGGSYIIDIHDPMTPVIVSEIECRGIHVRTIDLGERLLMTVSAQSDDNCPDANTVGGIRLIDVTDPADPIVGPQVQLDFGSHTHTPYGDTGIIYNSAYNLYTNILAHQNPMQHMRSEIIDVTDWSAPKVIGSFDFPTGSVSPGCHDIYPEVERNRTICAAITETQIWDTSDPAAPRLVSTIVNPLLTIHHTAATSNDGNILLIGEEWTGAIGPGCFDGGAALPMGSIWFYDISDPANPRELSNFAPPHQGPETPCTAHNFNIIEGHDVVVAAFFRAGTMLIDFSDPTMPKLIQQLLPDGTDVWAAYYHHGHVFTGDRGRGVDVLGFTAAGAAHEHAAGLHIALPNLS